MKGRRPFKDAVSEYCSRAMRRVSRLAFVGWFIVSAGGCAAVTGLDCIQEQDCAPNCADAQGTHDVTVPDTSTGGGSSSGADTSVGNDVGPEGSGEGSSGSSSGGPETSTGDAPHEGSTGEGGKEGGAGDTGTDSPPDSPPDGPKDTGTDTGTVVDSGCGATNTLQNCGACGQMCATGGTDGVQGERRRLHGHDVPLPVQHGLPRLQRGRRIRPRRLRVRHDGCLDGCLLRHGVPHRAHRRHGPAGVGERELLRLQPVGHVQLPARERRMLGVLRHAGRLRSSGRVQQHGDRRGHG